MTFLLESACPHKCGAPYYANITIPASHTGDLIETELGRLTIPPNFMGANGSIYIQSLWEGFPTGSGHRFYIYFGQKLLANRISYFVHATHYLVDARPVIVYNKNATNAQGAPDTTGNNLAMIYHNFINVSPLAMTEDTTQGVDIILTGKVDNAAHTVTLHFASLKVYYRE